MDNKTQNILQKFSKQKVELALFDNLMKEYGSLQTLGLESDMLEIASKLERRIPEYKTLKNKFDDVFQKAKELGVDKMANDAKEFSTACSNRIKKLEKQASSLKAITKR